jgi:hypothetical protein
LTFDPHPLRWIELGLPHPDDPDRLLLLKADGPFALRAWYYAPGTRREIHLHLDRRTAAGGLTGCLGCGAIELYTRKKFPKSLGVGIVVLAAILAPFTMYGPVPISLVVATLLDAILYVFADEEVVCYACKAEHRGFRKEPRHPRFDRTIEERLKFGDKAVMGSPPREGGTAGAPDPEH